MLEIIDVFGLGKEDIPLVKQEQGKSKAVKSLGNNGRKGGCKSRCHFDYTKAVQKNYMNIRKPENKTIRDEISLKNRQKNYLLVGEEIKQNDKMKQINQARNFEGNGREECSSIDFFVLTRVLNHPELLFNQQTKYDRDIANRFFRKDSMLEWQISNGNECYICNRYQYTMIFYERGILAQNTELTEIKDERILNELKYEF